MSIVLMFVDTIKSPDSWQPLGGGYLSKPLGCLCWYSPVRQHAQA